MYGSSKALMLASALGLFLGTHCWAQAPDGAAIFKTKCAVVI